MGVETGTKTTGRALRGRLGPLTVAVALLCGALTLSTSAGATPVSPPSGTIACSGLIGVIKWEPALKSTPAPHHVKVQAVADGCDASWATGGKAPIASLTLTGTAAVASMSCSDLAAGAIPLPLKVAFWSGPNGSGTKVSTATVSAQMTPEAFALTGSVDAGAFSGATLGATNANVFESPSELASLCAAPFGLGSASFSGAMEIESPTAAPVVNATLGALESVIVNYPTPGATSFHLWRAGPYLAAAVPSPIPTTDWIDFGTTAQPTYTDQLTVPGRSYVYRVQTDDLLDTSSLPTQYDLPVVLQSVTPPANPCAPLVNGTGHSQYVYQCTIPYGSFPQFTVKAFAINGLGVPLGPVFSYTTSWNDSIPTFDLCPASVPATCGAQGYWLKVAAGNFYDIELFYIDATGTATAYAYVHNFFFP